ncbi:MAG: acyltransferase [Bacteroidales bacterium]|nr:acyltransferase [Bacteroidales bacterium]
MKISNIILGNNVEIDLLTSINNVIIGDGVRISKNCNLYGSPENLLEIGVNSYVGMNCIINGFAAKLKIGSYVSIAQNVNIMVDSGPNASLAMQNVFPIVKRAVVIGNHVWIGAGSIIMPGVVLGDFCIVAANSYVNKSFDSFTIIGGNPAKVIRTFTEEEKQKFLG